MSNALRPIFIEKTAISNIVRFTSTSTIFYKYRINYEPDEIHEEAKRALVGKALGSTHTLFLITGSYIYCTHPIQYDCINTSWEGIPIKIVFYFEMQNKLTNDRQLLQLLIERFIKLEPIEFGNEKLVFELNVVNSIRNKENLLHIDFLFYVVNEKLWTHKTWCPYDSRKTRVFFNKQIYSVCSFSKEDNLLNLESTNGQVVSALPNLCYEVDSVDKILFGPSNIMIPITKLLACQELKIWNLHFNENLKVKARILPPEKVKFGNGIGCIPKNGNWVSELRENEFFNPIELWSWCIVYTESDFLDARLLVARMRKLPEDTGVLIGEPLYLQISDSISGYVESINSIASKNLQIVIVFIPNTKNKPERLIKYLCSVRNSIPFLILRSAEIVSSNQVHDVLLKINTILGGSPWSIDISQFKDTMFCGNDFYSPKDATKPKVCSLVANLSDDGFSWHSYSEIIYGNILSYLGVSMEDAMKKYCYINGRLPKRIVICQRAEYHNYDVLRSFYKQHLSLTSYDNIEVMVLLVRTNSEALFFRTSNGIALNVPSGTVINDPLSTDDNNFYLTSQHSSSTEVVRPTHYNIVHNTCKLACPDLLTMTYKMCHLDYALPEICEIPAPLSYARKLCILIEKLGVVPKSSDLNDFLYYL